MSRTGVLAWRTRVLAWRTGVLVWRTRIAARQCPRSRASLPVARSSFRVAPTSSPVPPSSSPVPATSMPRARPSLPVATTPTPVPTALLPVARTKLAIIAPCVPVVDSSARSQPRSQAIWAPFRPVNAAVQVAITRDSRVAPLRFRGLTRSLAICAAAKDRNLPVHLVRLLLADPPRALAARDRRRHDLVFHRDRGDFPLRGSRRARELARKVRPRTEHSRTDLRDRPLPSGHQLA